METSKVNFSEQRIYCCSSLRPLWRSGSDLNRNLWLYGCGEKRAIRGVGPIYRVTWCRMVFFCAAPVYSIAYTYTGCLLQEGGSLPFQILRSLSHRLWNIEQPKSKSQRSLVWTRYLKQDFGCPGPRSGLNGSMILYFLRGDQRFVTIFVILRCHRFLCEDVAQIKEVSAGRQHICFCANFLFFVKNEDSYHLGKKNLFSEN